MLKTGIMMANKIMADIYSNTVGFKPYITHRKSEIKIVFKPGNK